MADLTGQTPAATYKGLLQVNDYTNGVDATSKYIQDGEGTDSALSVSTTNVGIGTDNAASGIKLHLSSENDDTLYAVTRFSADTQQFDVGVGGSNVVIPGLRNKFYIYDSTNPATRLVVDGDGNVGIGNTSPDAKLHLRENVAGEDLLIGFTATNSGGTGVNAYIKYMPDADFLTFSPNKSGSALGIDATGNVGIGTTSPSAPLEVSSTTGGVIMPRMTTSQRNAIASPTDGEMVYDTDLNKFYGYANGAWTALH